MIDAIKTRLAEVVQDRDNAQAARQTADQMLGTANRALLETFETSFAQFEQMLELFHESGVGDQIIAKAVNGLRFQLYSSELECDHCGTEFEPCDGLVYCSSTCAREAHE